MANSAIRDLSTAILSADSALPLQNTSAATRAEQTAFSELGGLVLSSDTMTTANLTASVGTLHQLTIAGLTAIRDFILPDTAAVGERVALYIVDGDPDYEVNIKTAAAGSLLNGTDHNSTAWSKVFIKNETVLFRCVVAGGAGGTDWIVENDGRIPCSTRMYMNTDATSLLAVPNTDYQVPLASITSDNCSAADTTNNHILIRRDGNYYLAGKTTPTNVGLDQEDFVVKVSSNNNATQLASAAHKSSGTGGFQSQQAANNAIALITGDTIEVWARSAYTANRSLRGVSAWSFLEVVEGLSR